MSSQRFSLYHFYRLCALSWASGFVCLSPQLNAEVAAPRVELHARVLNDPTSGLPDKIEGKLRIHNWQTSGERCFYLPFNDPDYGDDFGTQRRLEMFSDRQNKVLFDHGRTTIDGSGITEKTAINAIFKLARTNKSDPNDMIELHFSSHLPRLPGNSDDDRFFESFYPQPLRECPQTESDGIYQRSTLNTHIDALLSIPSGWKYAGPGQPLAKPASGQDGIDIHIKTQGRNLAFLLNRRLQTLEITAAGVPVRLYYHSEKFPELISTIRTALEMQQKLFGPYPFESLSIVETSELQHHGLPGIISLNVPRQAAFNALQKNWLNWQHWMITTQISMQWLGASLHAKTPDDEWLLAGMAEFATLETLKHLPQRYNLFNATDEGYRLLSFDYLQISEISAATLQRHAPFFVLTDTNLQTALPFRAQPGLAYVKHAFALRQLRAHGGEAAFYGLLRNFAQQYAFQDITPKDFYAFINRLPSPFSPPLRRGLQNSLTRWWLDEGFPDFSLSQFSKHQAPDGKWIAKITAEQIGSLDFAPLISVKDEQNRTYSMRAEKPRKDGDQDNDGDWLATIITETEPVDVIIDPNHETFDTDRFNNRNGLPSVQFFPGTAETLRDDAYTVIWLPYVLRRPGEPTSVGLQSAIFRYIQSGMTMRAETAPAEKLGAFELRQRYSLLRYGITGDVSLAQNYDNDRLAEAAIIRSPLFVGEPNISLNLRLRHHEHVGDDRSRHQTIVIGAGLKPAASGLRCGYSLAGNFEYAPETLAHGFSYERRTGLVTGNCRLTAQSELASRLFLGSLTHAGETPSSAYFKPTLLQEARLRLDLRGLARVEKIAALGTDLLLPFKMPLPADSMILTRQMRWRLFYDYGVGEGREGAAKTSSETESIHYRATGLGFLLPLGGDLSGAGSLAFTRLSLLAALYSNAEGQLSRRPGILFDITGEL